MKDIACWACARAGVALAAGAALAASLPGSASAACLPIPDGLVSWWPLDDGGSDFTGRNPGTAVGTHGWAEGYVGGALYLDGTHDEVSAYGPFLNVGAGPGLTVEGWIKADSVTNAQPIAEWNNRQGAAGVHFWLAQPPPLGNGRGSLYANLLDAGGASHIIASGPGYVESGLWHHVALTYDRSNGVAALYAGGNLLSRSNLGTFLPQTGPAYALFFGRRAATFGYEFRFAGGMDEMSLYGRALADAEIASLSHAGTNGKCRVPFSPAIIGEPQSQAVPWETELALGVTAVGTAPLHYQWYFNGVAIAGEKDLHLMVASAQPAQAGNYVVVITNAGGAVTSAVAVVTVKPPPTRIRSLATLGLSEGTLTLALAVDAQGFERMLQFNLGFPVSLLSYRAAALASELPEGTRLSVATNDLAAGRVGISITLPEGMTLTPTNHPLALVQFTVASVTNEIPVTLTFESGPLAPGVFGVDGTPLLMLQDPAEAVLSSSRLEVVSVAADPGGMVEVPLRHSSIGRENAIGLSVSFPPEQLRLVSVSTHPVLVLVTNTAQLALGNLGLAALVSDLTTAFPRGTNDLFRLKFLVSASAAGAVVPLRLSDAVLPREFSDTNSIRFPGVFQDGTVTVAGVGFEADVAPGSGSDGSVRAQDWARVGRFAAGLELVEPLLFARADCAPRETKGDGLISLIDWVQAGRYYFGLDPLRQAGGPASANAPGPAPALPAAQASRNVSLRGTNVAAGALVRVPLRMSGAGNENAVAFSVRFDPSQVAFVNALAAPGLPEVYWQRNTNAAPEGSVGLMAALGPGDALAMGERALLTLVFRARETASGKVDLTFVDQPARCEVADVGARILPATFVGGTIQIDPGAAGSGSARR